MRKLIEAHSATNRMSRALGNMLILSLLANVVLSVAIIAVLALARHAVIREKLVTYAGCIAAISEGLCLDDSERRVDAIASGLSRMRQGETTDDDQVELKTFLLRAGLLRIFRPATLADLGEHLRKLALDSVESGHDIALKVCDYIAQPDHNNFGQVIEPIQKFGGDAIVTAQLQIERDIVSGYAQRVQRAPVKLFGA